MSVFLTKFVELLKILFYFANLYFYFILTNTAVGNGNRHNVGNLTLSFRKQNCHLSKNINYLFIICT